MSAKNQSALRDKRRALVSKWYLFGKTQLEIVTILRRSGIKSAQTTVSDDLKAIRAEWVKDSQEKFATRLGEELAKIDHLEHMAVMEFMRSMEPAEGETTTTKRALRAPPKVNGNGKNGKVAGVASEPTLATISEEIQKWKKGRVADPRFMERIAWCIEMRCRLVGLLKPEQHQQNVFVMPPTFWDDLAGGGDPEPDAVKSRIDQTIRERLEDKK